MQAFDVVIVGAGAAGLFCAGVAGQRGLRVLLLDHSEKLAEKIRISGGGRCNFTNRLLDLSAPQRHFLSENPNFCRSALSRYTPADFMALMARHGVPFHEKHQGQLFCDRSAEDVIALLRAECEAGDVTRQQLCTVKNIHFFDKNQCQSSGYSYEIHSNQGNILTRAVVIATGGLSIPKIGATDFGHRVARQFGLRVVPPRPGLVPLTFDPGAWAPYAELAGLSLPVDIETGAGKARMRFSEDLLFTHRGLSGPAVLQISSYWQEGTPICLNLAPGLDVREALAHAKARSRKLLVNELSTLIPARLAETWTRHDPVWQRPIAEVPDKALNQLAERLTRWTLTPTGTEGWRKAEVTLGGVDTRDLSSRTMESKQAGLYFIGEVVDVAGWLGGYNFQWAWASAWACGQALAAQLGPAPTEKL